MGVKLPGNITCTVGVRKMKSEVRPNVAALLCWVVCFLSPTQGPDWSWLHWTDHPHNAEFVLDRFISQEVSYLRYYTKLLFYLTDYICKNNELGYVFILNMICEDSFILIISQDEMDWNHQGVEYIYLKVQ